MKLAIYGIGGYPNLRGVILPIVVNAQLSYEGCYSVYAEEFRGHTTAEKMPEANQGRGLSHSFYDEDKFKVI